VLVEGDGGDAVAGDLAVEDRVGLARAHHAQPAVRREGLHHRPRDEALHRGLAGAVAEDGDRDRPDVRGQRAADRVAAPPRQQGRHEREGGARPHERVTTLTSRLGTTTTRSTARPWSHGCTLASASASCWMVASAASTSTVRRLRTLPSTCRITVTSLRTS